MKRKKKKTNYLSIILSFTLVIVGIFLIASLAQYISTGTSFIEDLSIVLTDKCTGSLSLTTTTGCAIKAKVLTSDCNGKTYQIREDSCSGGILCQDTISYNSFQATCAWAIPSGNYNYVLCVNNREEDSTRVECK